MVRLYCTIHLLPEVNLDLAAEATVDWLDLVRLVGWHLVVVNAPLFEEVDA